MRKGLGNNIGSTSVCDSVRSNIRNNVNNNVGENVDNGIGLNIWVIIRNCLLTSNICEIIWDNKTPRPIINPKMKLYINNQINENI